MFGPIMHGYSILRIIGHWIDGEWKFMDMILDAVEIKDQHTGLNRSTYVLKTLQDFEIEDKIFCITGDSASNNQTLGQELNKNLEKFNSNENMLGCVG